MIEAVGKAGYEAKVIAEADHASHQHEKEGIWSVNALLGIIPTVILMAGEWLFRIGDAGWYLWTSFALAAVVQFGPGRHFYRGAWNQLKARSSNMDTLVALGSTTAFAYSSWALLSGAGGHLYFMQAAAIITLISVGHWMEARVSAQASSSLKALMNLAPARARRRQPDGTEQEVAVAELQLNVVMVLKPGDRVPTDGEVVEGSSAVDESMLTGESMPVEKAGGAKIYAGTVNQSVFPCAPDRWVVFRPSPGLHLSCVSRISRTQLQTQDKKRPPRSGGRGYGLRWSGGGRSRGNGGGRSPGRGGRGSLPSRGNGPGLSSPSRNC